MVCLRHRTLNLNRFRLSLPLNLEFKSPESQKLNVSRFVWQLSVPNPLKPGVKSKMKMLEQHRQVLFYVQNLEGAISQSFLHSILGVVSRMIDIHNKIYP